MGKTTTAHRKGETIRAKNGQLMTIIAYRSSRDIDVQFEDGTIVQHRQYHEFKKGWIKNPNIPARSHIGETNIAKNGQKMTIVAWRAYKDIDVQFEDGTVVCNRAYHIFQEGYIKNPNAEYGPNIQRTINAKNRHIGEIRTAKNGLKMTLIAYRTSEDIDVRFEDGVEVFHRDYSSFDKGNIGHPNISLQRSCQHIRTDRIGESTLALNGLKAAIVEYKNYNTMRVKFETGYITDNTQYIQFQKKMIRHPFPYQIGSVSMDRPAYIYNGAGNFYCHCTKCGLEDIMTVQEMREHICQS